MNMTTVPSNQLKAMQHEIAEKAAEIERLCVSVNYKHSKICELSNQLASQELVIQELRDALEKITQFASVQICSHDETYRGGNIWEICSQCGAKWADGEGGKPEFVEPKQITEAIKALAILPSPEHLEAWYKERGKQECLPKKD